MKHQHCVKDFQPIETLEGNRGEFELWGAVLLQAVEDFHRRGPSFEIVINGIRLRGRKDSTEIRRNRNNAAAWFRSSRENVGSFLWICYLFGLDADLVRAEVKKKNFKLTR